MQYTLEHGDVCLGNDVVGLSKITETLNAQQERIEGLNNALTDLIDAAERLKHLDMGDDYSVESDGYEKFLDVLNGVSGWHGTIKAAAVKAFEANPNE